MYMNEQAYFAKMRQKAYLVVKGLNTLLLFLISSYSMKN